MFHEQQPFQRAWGTSIDPWQQGIHDGKNSRYTQWIGWDFFMTINDNFMDTWTYLYTLGIEVYNRDAMDAMDAICYFWCQNSQVIRTEKMPRIKHHQTWDRVDYTVLRYNMTNNNYGNWVCVCVWKWGIAISITCGFGVREIGKFTNDILSELVSSWLKLIKQKLGYGWKNRGFMGSCSSCLHVFSTSCQRLRSTAVAFCTQWG